MKRPLVYGNRILIVFLFALLRYCVPLALAEPVDLEKALLALLPFTQDLQDHSAEKLAVKTNGVVELRAEGAWFTIHEFGHEHSLDHLSSEYHEAVCRIGARLFALARHGDL
jgi:hypothetical protein